MPRHYFSGLIWKKTEQEIKALNSKISKVTKLSATNILIEAEPKLNDAELNEISEALHSNAEDPQVNTTENIIENVLKEKNLI